MKKTSLLGLICTSLAVGVCFLPPFAGKIFLVGLCISLVLLMLAIQIQNAVIKYVFIGLFSLALPITLVEGYSTILIQIYSRAPIERVELSGKKYTELDERIGYKPIANNDFTIRANRGDTILYEASYSMDSGGRRITPEHPEAKYAVLLFGGSFTFSEGVNNSEAMAWKLGELLGSEYQVYNFGYSGYGTHNILAIIENTLPDLQKYERIYTYFITIDDHLRRVVGASNLIKTNPRYTIQGDKAVRTGSFDGVTVFPWDKKGFTWLRGSSIVKFYNKHLMKFLLPFMVEEDPTKLMQALLLTANAKLAEKYSQNTSTVLLWPETGPSPLVQTLTPLLKDMPVLGMESWLPGVADDVWKYKILIDGHPNVLANTLVSKGLAKLIQDSSR